MLFCNKEIGKTFVGNELNHKRKEGCVFSRPAFVSIISQIFSRLGIQLGDRWQFYRKTHVPFFYASSIAFSAWIPYPYPNEIIFITLLLASAKFCRIAIGSVPGRRKNKGFTAVASKNDRLISNVGEFMKVCPY